MCTCSRTNRELRRSAAADRSARPRLGGVAMDSRQLTKTTGSTAPTENGRLAVAVLVVRYSTTPLSKEKGKWISRS